MMVLIFALLSMFGCSAPDAQDTACNDNDETTVLVVTTLAFMRAGSDGLSNGFDIDGTDESVCGISDYVDYDGNTGIDNGFAQLIPILEASEAKVVEELINEAIVEGRIMLVLEISNVDDLENDSCVDTKFLQAMGEPLLGTQGGILPGQTLLRNPDTPESSVNGLSIVDGRLDVRPLNLDIPLSILDATFEINMTRGGIQVNMGEDGFHSGFFTGALAQSEIFEILYSSNGIDDDIQALVEGVLPLFQDLESMDGEECAEMSVGLEFEAVEIFLMDE